MKNANKHYRFLVGALAMMSLGLGCATTGKVATAPDYPVAVKKAAVTGPDSNQPSISSHAKLLFEDAVRAFETQKKSGAFDYASLARKFQGALDADSKLAEAEYNLGVIAERQGKTDQAISYYRSALRSRPSLKEAAENLAVITQNNGDTHGALKLYEDILKQYPDDATSRARIAELYRQAGDPDRALELARQSLMRDPKSIQAHKVMLFSYLDRRNLSLAKLVAMRALKIDDADPELHYAMGLIHLQHHEDDKALVQFKKAVEIRPDYLPARIHLARISLDKEDYKGAEDSLRRILQFDGKNAGVHLNLGIAYRGQGQYDKAMQEYEIAEKLNPDIPAIYLNQGIILHRYKDAAERGLELYKKYLALSGGGVPTEAPVFALIGEAQQVIATKEEAKRLEAEQQKQDEEEKRNRQLHAKEEHEKNKADPAQGKTATQVKDNSAGTNKGSVKPAKGRGKIDLSDKAPRAEKLPSPSHDLPKD